jgi:hypothetical protein
MLAKFHKCIKSGALLNPKMILHFFHFVLMKIKTKEQIRVIKKQQQRGCWTRLNRARQGPVQPVP